MMGKKPLGCFCRQSEVQVLSMITPSSMDKLVMPAGVYMSIYIFWQLYIIRVLYKSGCH